MPPLVSWAVDCGAPPPAVREGDVWLGRAPPEAHAVASSRNPSTADSCRMQDLLFHEFKYHRRASRSDPNQSPRRLLGYMHHHRQLQSREVESKRGEGARGHLNLLDPRHLHRHDLRGSLAGREDVEIERLSLGKR